MAKVNAYRLRLEKPERRTVGPIVNPDNPDEVLEIEFQYLDDSMILAAADMSDELVETYIESSDKKPLPMPIDFSGNCVTPSKRLFRLVTQLVVMQTETDEEKRYDWKEFAFLQAAPWAWGPILEAYNAMSTPKEKKAEASTGEPLNSANTTSTSTPNISLEPIGSPAEDTAVSG